MNNVKASAKIKRIYYVTLPYCYFLIIQSIPDYPESDLIFRITWIKLKKAGLRAYIYSTYFYCVSNKPINQLTNKYNKKAN